MINYAYGQRNQYNSTPVRTILCGLVFADLTAFFFLSFMNICFDTIVSDPPVWLLFILFMVMALDLFAQLYLNRRLTFNFCLHFLIMIFLILSWATKKSSILFLSSLIFVRFPEIVRFNEIMQEKLRSYDKLFKLYTVLKIFYMIAVVGHVLGCIFYAIDNTLIKAEYYGTIQQNPTMYYQGTLLCYSPIYSLSQINRYLYAMYYIFSLLATVAYGDIIPKNPFENAYVCILLVLSTVSISFIIEQLLIVLSDNWQTIYQILKKLKYFDSMLQKSINVSSVSRLKLTSFIFHSMKHEANNNPNINRLTPSLQFRLMSESIGMRKKIHNFSTNEGLNKITNLRIIEEYSYPTFLVQFLLLKLQLKYYPNKYLIVDNENPFQETSIYISLRGELKVGYGPNFMMRKTLRYKNRLFCWREFVLDNKYLHRHFRIQTRVLSQLYTIGTEFLKAMIKEERQKHISDGNFSQLLEMYHIARQNQLLLMQEQSLQMSHSTQSLNLIQLEENQQDQQDYQVSHHIIRCWGCGHRTHFPINCSNLHYKVNIHEVLAHEHRKVGRSSKFSRKKTVSKKVRPTYKQISQYEESKIFLKKFLVKKSQEMKNLKNLLVGTSAKIFEQYEGYESYFHQFNFSTHNNEPL